MTLQPVADHDGTGLAAHMTGRVDRSRKHGRKRIPQDNCVLPRTAEQLIRRIAKVTTEAHPDWAEANDVVAKALHVNRSTVIRTVRRLCEVGILIPVETKGGRGHVSVYRVNTSLAEEDLRSGRWPDGSRNRRTEEAQEEGQIAGQREEPAQRMPPFQQDSSSHQTPTRDAYEDALPNVHVASGGQPVFADLDPALLASLGAMYREPGAPLSHPGVRDWWDRQPEEVRRALRTTSIGALLVAAAGLVGGWRGALVAALLCTPPEIEYALSSERQEAAGPMTTPGKPAPVDGVAASFSADPPVQNPASGAARLFL